MMTLKGTFDIMRQSRGSHRSHPQGFCQECIDVVKLARVFKARLVVPANNLVKLRVNFGLEFF
jgi:hypothetical protein